MKQNGLTTMVFGYDHHKYCGKIEAGHVMTHLMTITVYGRKSRTTCVLLTVWSDWPAFPYVEWFRLKIDFRPFIKIVLPLSKWGQRRAGWWWNSPTYLLFSTPRWRPPVEAVVVGGPHRVTNNKECEVAHSELLLSYSKHNRQATQNWHGRCLKRLTIYNNRQNRNGKRKGEGEKSRPHTCSSIAVSRKQQLGFLCSQLDCAACFSKLGNFKRGGLQFWLKCTLLEGAVFV